VTRTVPEPTGSLATALAHAARLLPGDPALAQVQAREILKVAPDHPPALLLLGAALRGCGDASSAAEVLEPLAAAHPDHPTVQFETGYALASLGRSRAAVRALRRAVELNPEQPHAWRLLGDQLTLLGETTEADAAYVRHIRWSVNDPALVEAALALCDNRLAIAERLLRAFLKRFPTDVAAIRMLAETGARLGRLEDAESLLARCLELAPGFTAARRNYAAVLNRRNKPVEAIAQADQILARDPNDPGCLSLKAAALGRIGEYAAALACYETVLGRHPEQPKLWMSYGHTLKTVGRLDDGIAAYRRSLDQQPSLGEAWWSLANLKTVRFDEADVAVMQAQLQRPDLDPEDRFHLHFALGKAHEDARAWAPSFEHYAAGNAQRRAVAPYDADETSAHVRRTKTLFTADFLAARAGWGCPAPDPIFVVGLPRAGSTLIEQILSSHSTVEGSMELPDVLALARRLGRPGGDAPDRYPEVMGELDADAVRALGEEYLERTRVQRKQGRPFFIDKMPNNFAHLGLIHLMLPNAKIVDARRHPLGCCFSGFKQHFARGQLFTYDLEDIGRYYADYVELTAWFDQILPGRVHRVIYEDMVADPETEIRRLLDYCGLPFEDGCLKFHENDRAVRTASSEQVRRPIFTEAAEHWRNYEPWLDPLKAALGPVLTAYPEAPRFD
jgi:predicted Zn-dependent protease